MNDFRDRFRETINKMIRDSIEEQKENIVEIVEKKVEEHFANRMEQLESRIEKDVEDFFMKKFDENINSISKSDCNKKIEEIKKSIHEILDIQEELINKIKEKPVNAELPETDIKKLTEVWEERFFEINKRLEDTKKILLAEISRVENKRLPPPPQESSEIEKVRRELTKRIERLENEIFDLEHSKRDEGKSGAIIVE